MPRSIKPCDGKLSEATIELLRHNREREQWANHACEICGQLGGVQLLMGKWVPERHWPSVLLKRTSRPSARAAAPAQGASAAAETRDLVLVGRC